MAEHCATIDWQDGGPDFKAGRYSREHSWTFDGGVTVPASPSPAVVPAPWSNAAHVDPEEAFVAAVASCHMLWWLSLAARAGYDVVSYHDHAVGEMTRNEQRALWISIVRLHPQVRYGPNAASAAAEARLHEQAHGQCFIANSIKSEVKVVAAP